MADDFGSHHGETLRASQAEGREIFVTPDPNQDLRKDS
jgi:hypothetical protein